MALFGEPCLPLLQRTDWSSTQCAGGRSTSLSLNLLSFNDLRNIDSVREASKIMTVSEEPRNDVEERPYLQNAITFHARISEKLQYD